MVRFGCPEKEVSTAAGDPVEKLAKRAAVKALGRLLSILEDPDTSHADVFKAFQLIFDRAYAGAGETPPEGDFDIIVKEE